MVKALVFGAHGFVARHTIERLARLPGVRVFASDIQGSPPAGLPVSGYRAADIARASQAAEILQDCRPDWVLNLAGVASGNAERVYQSNLMGAVNVMQAVLDQQRDIRVLLIGSAAEYGRVEEDALPIREDQPCSPIGHYGVSKHAMTLAAQSYVELHGMKIVIARPFNIIGAGVSPSLLVGAILQRAKAALEAGEPSIKVGNLETARDFIAVEDAAEAFTLMVQGDAWGEVFNVCTGRPTPIREVVEYALTLAPRPLHLEVDPGLFRASDVKCVYGSGEKARRTFGFVPKILVEEAVRSAWEFVMRAPGRSEAV
jgi:GDP-4-dehydro-6-deoxy-D-mannose reductase